MENRTPAPQFTSPTLAPNAPVVSQNSAISPSAWATLLKARRDAILGQQAALRRELAEVEKLLSCAQ